MDCEDGSDEDERYCDTSQTEGYFVCCSVNKKIPSDKVCDNFDDCSRDKTDSYLEACQIETGGALKGSFSSAHRIEHLFSEK